MLRIWLVSVLVFITLISKGQNFPSEFWHSGKVVLVSGDTVAGDVKYDLENDIVRVNTPDKMYTFSSRKIFFFEIFDITVDNYRQFYALPHYVRPNYKAPVLFEVVFEGKLTLLARESIVNQTTHYNSYYWSGGTYSRQALVYDFYFLFKDGEIVRYSKKRRDLLKILKSKSSEIKQFIKKNNLKPDKKRDLARIMAYYNALIDS